MQSDGTIINQAVSHELRRKRIAVFLLYFCLGLMFSSWASRIPDIKTRLHLSDAELGTILFALPVAQFSMMTFSGKLVTRFGSKAIALIALPLYSICLSVIGFANEGWQLAAILFAFGISGNMCNISVNTQGVAVEHLYNRPIMSTFHGGWSLAGFTGGLVGLTMINLGVKPLLHFLSVIVLVWLIIIFNRKHLVPGKPERDPSEPPRKFFNRPDRALVVLGIVGFFSMASEGCMFDWSGVYFKDVVKAPASMVTLGYTSFFIMMATGRFLADWFTTKIGRKRLLQISGVMISSGLYLAVIYPDIVVSAVAFMMVGLGVSSVVPSVYSAAGKYGKIPPGIAIATVASVSFLGFLMGPPLIGYISEAFGLRYSFAFIGMFGLGITILIGRVKSIH
jgi:MFS family permease